MDSTRTALLHRPAAHRARVPVPVLVLTVLALLAATPSHAQSLYRCSGTNVVTTWQDAPCPDGTQQSVRPYDPQLAGTPEQQQEREAGRARVAETRERLRAAAARASRPRATRGGPRERSNAACEQARQLARLRSDESGHRIPALTIRARERQAHAACRGR